MTFPISLLAMTLVLAPAAAQAASYAAVPTTPTAVRKVIVRDINWSCGPAACQGATEYSRPLVLCQRLAREVGTLGSFLVDGHAMGDADLARCNAVVRGPAAAPALARAN